MRPLSRRRKTDLLRDVPLFTHCSQKELDAIAALTSEIQLASGRDLTLEGSAGREFFILLDGHAVVRRNHRKIGTLGSGDFVGEISLVAGLPRTATVTTTEPTRVLVVAAHDFRGLLLQAPTLSLKILEALGTRVADMLREV